MTEPANEDTPKSALHHILMLIAIALMGVQATLVPSQQRTMSLSVLAGSVCLLVIAHLHGSLPAKKIVALSAMLIGFQQLPIPWQAMMVMALLTLFAYLKLTTGSWGISDVVSKGKLPLWPTVFVGGVTPFALSMWLFFVRPELNDLKNSPMLHVPLPLLIIGAVLFSIINPLLEEAVWRGVIQTNASITFNGPQAILLSALSFGIQHFHGFPRGWIGVGLAGFWAAMLGVLRRYTQGLLAPIVAHIVADATIACLVLVYVL